MCGLSVEASLLRFTFRETTAVCPDAKTDARNSRKQMSFRNVLSAQRDRTAGPKGVIARECTEPASETQGKLGSGQFQKAEGIFSQISFVNHAGELYLVQHPPNFWPE